MCEISEKEKEKKPGNVKEPPVDRMQISQALSEIYTSVYYIDLAQNHFTELSSKAEVHETIGAEGDAQEKLNYF